MAIQDVLDLHICIAGAGKSFEISDLSSTSHEYQAWVVWRAP